MFFILRKLQKVCRYIETNFKNSILPYQTENNHFEMRKTIPLLLLLFTVSSCVIYNKMWVGPTSVFEDEKIKKNLDKKEIIVHDYYGNHSLLLTPEMTKNSISGEPMKLDTVVVPERLIKPADKAKKNQIHFYITDTLKEDDRTITIDKVREVAIYKPSATTGPSALKSVPWWYWLLSFLLVFGLFYWAIVKLVNSVDDAVSSCYIATMVYGDYDAPEVMTLRNFRDQVLRKYFFGKAFIGFYYLVSPKVVRLTRNMPRVNSIFRKILDRMVYKLRSRGIE